MNSQWVITSFDTSCRDDPEMCHISGEELQVGDQMVLIGSLSHAEYKRDPLAVIFSGYGPEDAITLVQMRNGITYVTEWRIPGPTHADRLSRLAGLLIFMPFWVAGTIVLLFLRPRDVRWRLLAIFNFATALWLSAGVVSVYHNAGSWIIMGVLSWLLMPIYLHLHLLVPVPLLSPTRLRYVTLLLYGAASIPAMLVILTIYGFPPDIAISSLGLALAIIGSIVLLLLRVFRSGSSTSAGRLAARLMLIGVTLAFGPAILLWAIPYLLQSTIQGQSAAIAISTAAILVLPFFYIYALYKRRLGNLEFRANRILGSYSFILIVATAFVLVFILLGQGVDFANSGLTFSLAVSLVFLGVALNLSRPFNRLLNRLAYGTEHDASDILRVFADEIPRALNRKALIELLTTEVAPSLFVRQSALYLVAEHEITHFYSDGLDPGYLAVENFDKPIKTSRNGTGKGRQIEALLAGVGIYRPPESDEQGEFAWVRLALAIEVGGKTIGVWLLGKRDPDDYYPQQDIQLLKTLANQIGVALETARLFDDLRQRADELQRAYEELQELDRLKEEFVQNISHELRTPLTLVHGYAELLRAELLGELNAEQKEALNIVFDRTNRTIQMVNDIISIQQALLEQVALEPVDIVEVARMSVQAVEVTAIKIGEENQHSPNARYHCELQVDGVIPKVWGASNRLGQVLDNLLNNAVKFSPEGGTILVQISTVHHRFPATGSQLRPLAAVEVIVRDQGVGIAADKTEQIWERFYQIDGSTTRRFGGMGLGLSIVQEIIEAHYGFIWVESSEGKGSAFHFVLPTEESASQVEAAKAAAKVGT